MTLPRPFLTALTLALLPVAGAGAGAPPPEMGRGARCGGDELETSQRAEASKRILHLAGGGVVRGETRWNGTSWEHKSGRDWRVVPGVERAVLEKDLLAELRRRKRAVGRASGNERVELARWLLGEGLSTECLAELDRVLSTEPDHAQALTLLRDGALRLRLPELDVEPEELAEARERYLRFAAGLPPAGRELAVRGLLALRDPIDLHRALESELSANTPLRRSFAALALRRLFPGRSLEPLLQRSVLDASSDVRRTSALALAEFEDEAVAAPLVRALGSAHGTVRSNAVDALAAAGYPAAVPSLIEHLGALALAPATRTAPAAHIFVGRQRAYIQDYDVEVAQFASIADPQIGTLIEGEVLDVRVLGISKATVASERATVRRALQSLTGADPGNTSKAWQRWWEEEGDAWLAAQRGPMSPRRAADG